MQVTNSLQKPIYTKELLNRDEVIELIERANEGDDNARNEVIERNMRLVISIASKYPNCGIEVDDLIQEGVFGVMKAVKKFEKERNTEFSTYATWWIRQSISEAIRNTSRLVRLPGGKHEEVNKIRKLQGYEFTEDELAEKLDISTAGVRDLLQLAQKETYSIHSSVETQDGSYKISDFLEDTHEENDTNVYQEVIDVLDSSVLEGLLTEREKDILILSFGLSDEGKQTLEKIGEKHGITKERTRQIKDAALTKLYLEKKGELAPLVSGKTCVTDN